MGRTAALWFLICIGTVGQSVAVTTVSLLTDSSSGDCSGGDPSTCNLRAAVALADQEPIHLSQGTHTITEGEISVSAATKLYGDGEHLVKIDGSSNSARLFSSSSTLEIMGVTISGFSSSDNGGAIFSAGTLTVSNSTFEQASTTSTGGNYDGGGAIFADVSSNLYLSGVHFDKCTSASMGGAVQLYGVSAAEVKTSNFTNNEAASNGGGVGYYLQSNSPTVVFSESSFSSNTALKGAAIGTLSYYPYQVLHIQDSDFLSNVGYQYGGAISLYASSSSAVAESTLDVSGSRFKANSVVKKNSGWSYDKTYGGGSIHTFSGTSSYPRLNTAISSCEFIDSGSWGNGGALFLSASSSFTTTISGGTTFSGSNASRYGNDIYLSNDGEPTCTTTACDPGTFINNTLTADCWDASGGDPEDGEVCNTCTFASECADCLAGKITESSDETSCTSCDSGTVAVKGSSSCTECEAGSMAAAAGDVCQECERGKYQSEALQTSCDSCEKGKYNSNTGSASSSDCMSCPSGTYNNNTASTSPHNCTACGYGTYSEVVGATSYTTCETCASGKYLAATGATSACECVDCPSGYHSSNVGSESCEICPRGTSAYAGATECSTCLAGTFANVSGSETCRVCASGKVSGDGASNCSVCVAGSYSTGDSCEKCSHGRFSSESGATECEACAAGSTSTSPFTSCEECEAGKYAEEEASDECSTCTGSKYSFAGAETCQTCAKGYALVRSNQSEVLYINCSSCDAGTYSETAGSSACTACEAGTYSSEAAATACLSCVAGKSSSSGAVDCVSCEGGKFSESGAASCESCDAGQYSTEGSSACFSCAAGRSSGSEATNCTDCHGGKFSEAGSGVCVPCDSGTYSTPGSSICLKCESGLEPAEDQTHCQGCSEGYYSADSACLPCDYGKFSASNGSSACDSCPPGTTTRDEGGASHCSLCASSYYAVQEELVVLSDSNDNEYDGLHAKCAECTDEDEGIATYSSAGSKVDTVEGVSLKCSESGVTLQNVDIKPGYWRHNDNSKAVYACLNPDACKGGRFGYNYTNKADDTCATGHEGPLCAVCSRNVGEAGTNYYQGSGFVCQACSGRRGFMALSGADSIKLLVIFLLMLVALGVAIKKRKEILEWIDHNTEKFNNSMTSLSILAITYQILIEFTSVHVSSGGSSLPKPFDSFISFFDFLSFDLVKIVPLGCMGRTDYRTSVLLMTLTPLFITAIALYLQHRFHYNRGVRNCYRMFYYILPTVSTAVVSCFRCRDLDGKEYLAIDYSVACDSDVYKAMMVYAIVNVLIYPVGVPCLFSGLLFLSRNDVNPLRVNPKMQVGTAMNMRHLNKNIKHLKFLFGPYELEYWWWASVDIIRRLLLTSVLLFFDEPGDQLIYTLSVCLVFVNVYREVRPYAHHIHNTGAHLLQWEILVVVIGVLLLETHLVKKSSTALGSILIVVNIITFIVVIVSQKSENKKVNKRASQLKRNEAGLLIEMNKLTKADREAIKSLSKAELVEMERLSVVGSARDLAVKRELSLRGEELNRGVHAASPMHGASPMDAKDLETAVASAELSPSDLETGNGPEAGDAEGGAEAEAGLGVAVGSDADDNELRAAEPGTPTPTARDVNGDLNGAAAMLETAKDKLSLATDTAREKFSSAKVTVSGWMRSVSRSPERQRSARRAMTPSQLPHEDDDAVHGIAAPPAATVPSSSANVVVEDDLRLEDAGEIGMGADVEQGPTSEPMGEPMAADMAGSERPEDGQEGGSEEGGTDEKALETEETGAVPDTGTVPT